MTSRLLFRLTIPLIGISFLLLAGAVVAAWSVQQLHQDLSYILSINVSSMRAAEELEIALHKVRSQLDQFLLSGERDELAAIPRMREDTDRWLREAERVATTEYEQRLMVSVNAGYEHFFGELERLTRKDQGTARTQLALRQLIDQVLLEEILQPVHDYLDFNEEQATERTAHNEWLTKQMVVVLLVLGLCGPAAGLLAGVGVAWRVTRSLVRLSMPLTAAAGQLNEVVGPVTLRPGWRLEDLEQVLHQMAGQIGAVIERLQESQRATLRAEQLAAFGQMAAGLAHELRNPLTSMKILVQSAEERSAQGLRDRDLAVLEEEICRLERLTSTLLDFARPPQPEKRSFEMQRLVEGTIELLQGRADQRLVSLQGDFPDEPIFLEADVGQLRQVVFNLLLNALEAVAPGGRVRASLRLASDGDEEAVLIEVADDGPGLPEPLMQDLFTPFVSTKETGLGLGLSICKRIVEAHGGIIEARHGPAGGAVFAVRLPMQGPALVAQK
jgi:signal transduction histidine kinase